MNAVISPNGQLRDSQLASLIGGKDAAAAGFFTGFANMGMHHFRSLVSPRHTIEIRSTGRKVLLYLVEEG